MIGWVSLWIVAHAFAVAPSAVIVPLQEGAPSAASSTGGVEIYSGEAVVRSHASSLPLPEERDHLLSAGGKVLDPKLDELARDKIYLQISSLAWSDFSALHGDWSEAEYRGARRAISHGRR